MAQEKSTGPKFYLVKAHERRPEEGKEPRKIEFVVEASSYKESWPAARRLLRRGSDHTTDVNWRDRREDFESKSGQVERQSIPPGDFAPDDVTSLNERKAKKPEVTLERLVAAAAEKGISIPSKLQRLMDDLKEKGPLMAAEDDGAGDDESGTGEPRDSGGVGDGAEAH